MHRAAHALDWPPVHVFLICFSALSFLGFGFTCFFWRPMQQEYVRYGVPQLRPLVGCLQIAGGLGLLLGLALPQIGQFAAAGLTLLMFFGVRLRIRIKDSLLQMLPAIFYFALNAYLLVASMLQ